jgi:ribonuclease HI
MILSLQMKGENMVVTGDSKLVINHITKKYRIKKEKLKHYAKIFCELMDSFNYFHISFIPREKNQKENSLVVAASLFNSEDS